MRLVGDEGIITVNSDNLDNKKDNNDNVETEEETELRDLDVPNISLPKQRTASQLFCLTPLHDLFLHFCFFCQISQIQMWQIQSSSDLCCGAFLSFKCYTTRCFCPVCLFISFLALKPFSHWSHAQRFVL